MGRNATCRDCNRTGHFTGMRACKSRKVESLNSLTKSNKVRFNIVGPSRKTEVNAEADTGASITVFKADMMEHLSWLELEDTSMVVQAYDGGSNTLLEKERAQFQRGHLTHEEHIYFSQDTKYNFYQGMLVLHWA